MKVWVKRVTAGVCLLLATGAAAEDEPEFLADALVRMDGKKVRYELIESRLTRLMGEVWLPGLSVAVVGDGEVVYQRGFGVRDVGSGASFTQETSFAGLSFSKTITAYLVMRLVERGTLELDTPLHTYLSKPLPEYEFYADLAGDDRYRKITARHVLSHTTGWPNWRWFTDDGKLSFWFDPGERHSYSGEGFAYLQLALEELTGKGFAELARSEVFEPLGMKRSSMVWQPEYEADYAEDHDFLGRSLRRDRRDEASAAGSLQTTLSDYARFVIAVLDSEGLKPASRDLMLSPQVQIRHSRMFGPRLYEETKEHEGSGLSWTLGWGRIASRYGPALFHTGNDRGSANYTIVFPGKRSAVILMGNSNRLEGIARDLVELLTSDRSSPFDFLGYEPWDGIRQQWLRTLAYDGGVEGRHYWERLGVHRASYGLDDEDAVAQGAETVAHFRSVDEAIAFQRWRRELFPESARAVRDHAKLLIEAGRAKEAIQVVESAEELAEELEWFSVWVRAMAAPATVAPETLQRFAGEYGARRFELRDGRLFYGRDATPAAEYTALVAVSEDTFVIPDADFFRLRFEGDLDGSPARVVGLYENGRTDSNERTVASAPD